MWLYPLSLGKMNVDRERKLQLTDLSDCKEVCVWYLSQEGNTWGDCDELGNNHDLGLQSEV